MFLGILTSIFGGAFGSEVKPGAIDTEQGFVDIDLPIVDMKLVRGVSTFAARGKLDGQIVGLVVDLLPDWTGKEAQDGGPVFYWGKARLRSLGEDSDRFIALLAKHYEADLAQPNMERRIDATAVGLNDNPEQAMRNPVKMKFFLAEENEDLYSEIFINVDPTNRVLQFHEKDPEYRRSLLRVLSGVT